MKNPYFLGILFSVFFCHLTTLTLAAEDEQQDQSLMLTSEVDLYSADVHINGEDPKEDKKRKIIGQGENVTITLTGKGVGERTDVKWVFSGNGGLLDESRGTTATLKASKTETGSITVHAEANGKKSDSLTFEIISPNGAEGEKNIENQIAAGQVGVDVIMHVTVQPTNVNFSNLAAVEEDHGTVPDPGSSSFPFPDHEPNPEAVPISQINHFKDHVKLSISSADAYAIVGAVQWDWVCKFRTTGVSSFFKETNQTFSLIRDRKIGLPPVDKIMVKIRKFDKEFSNEYKFN